MPPTSSSTASSASAYPGHEQAEAEQVLRATGRSQQADLLSGMTLDPGRASTSRPVTGDCSGDAGVCAQFTVLLGPELPDGRSDAANDVPPTRGGRPQTGPTPLKYFDDHARGDLLSRVTNDIDNISTTLQQTLTQMITSVLTVIGVLIMMVWISPLLAIISLLTVPLSFFVTVTIAKRSQRKFVGQWKWTGILNGHVEEMYSGHELVKVYGHQQEAIAKFDGERTDVPQQLPGAVHLRDHPTCDGLHRDLNHRDRCGGWPSGGQRNHVAGEMQAFIQYSR